MTRRRRREPSKRGEEKPWTLLAILGIAVLVGATTAFAPAGAFTSAALDRPGQMDVTLEEAGALELTIADCMDDNGWSDMVTVTNRLNTTADVTVALQDPSVGSIKGSGTGSLTVTLAQGGSSTYEFKYAGSGPYPDPVDFDVSAVGTGISVDAIRGSAVDSDGVGCDGGTTTTTTTTSTSTATTSTTTTTTSANNPPTADFTYVRQNKNFVDLDGSASTDSDGTIVTYQWDVGDDGSIDHTGQTATKVRAGSGTDIRLIVTDNDGVSDSVVITV